MTAEELRALLYSPRVDYAASRVLSALEGGDLSTGEIAVLIAHLHGLFSTVVPRWAVEHGEDPELASEAIALEVQAGCVEGEQYLAERAGRARGVN